MVDVSEELSRNPNISLEMFAKIQTHIQKQHPKMDDDLPPDWLVVAPQVDTHDQTVVAALADVDEQEAFESVTPFSWARRIPTNVRAYDLIHDDSNATGITFPNAMDETLKWGAGAKTDGASYQIINDHAWFDVNDIVIALHLKLPATQGGDGIQTIIEKSGTFLIQIDAHATASNQIRCSTTNGTAKEITFTYTADTFFSLILHSDASNITVWEDNVQQGQVATGATPDTNANNVGIWGTASGTQLMKANGMIAFLTIADKDIIVDSAWRTAYHTDAILDYEDATNEEITTYPYLQTVKAEPNSHSGFFWG